MKVGDTLVDKKTGRKFVIVEMDDRHVKLDDGHWRSIEKAYERFEHEHSDSDDADSGGRPDEPPGPGLDADDRDDGREEEDSRGDAGPERKAGRLGDDESGPLYKDGVR